MAIWQYAGDDPTGKTREYDLQGKIILLEETYPGAVLARREENWHEDSDFYAVVWDEEEQRLRRVDYATTRGCTYGCSATVDATKEVIEKATAWLSIWWLDQLTDQEEREVLVPRVGRTVKVVKGRKVVIGTEGKVFWYDKGRYGRMRVGFVVAEGVELWTDAANVEVLNPEQHGWDREYTERLAGERAKSNYHYPLSSCAVSL